MTTQGRPYCLTIRDYSYRHICNHNITITPYGRRRHWWIHCCKRGFWKKLAVTHRKCEFLLPPVSVALWAHRSLDIQGCTKSPARQRTRLSSVLESDPYQEDEVKCFIVDNHNSGEGDTNITGLRARGKLLQFIEGFPGGQRLSFYGIIYKLKYWRQRVFLEWLHDTWKSCVWGRSCALVGVYVRVYGHATKSSIGWHDKVNKKECLRPGLDGPGLICADSTVLVEQTQELSSRHDTKQGSLANSEYLNRCI